MVFHRILIVLRALLLLAALGWLVTSLVTALRADRAPLENLAGAATRSEPGLRVLLRDRAEDRDHHRQLSVFVAQPSVLYAPADKDLWREVPASSRLVVQPDPQRGLIITSRALGEDLVWAQTRVRLVPRAHSDDARAAGDPLAELDLATIEARNRLPVFGLGNLRYRGCLELVWGGPRTLYALNTLPIEAYLEGVLQSELAANWPIEALKAQAVASRSFAYARLLAGGRKLGDFRFDCFDTVLDQEYLGTGNGGPRIDWALEETRGVILTVEGVPFAPFFHASSGGQLAGVDTVFPNSRAADGRTPLSLAMPAKEDPWCRPGIAALGFTGSHWKNQVVLRSGDLRELLRAAGHEVGFPQRLTVERGPGGRVARVTIGFFGQELSLPGTTFRHLVGPRRLRSTLWDAESPRESTNNVFTLTTYGWGHGVGMSQVSAYAMARDGGADHRAILAFFYPGSEAIRAW